MQPDNFEEKFKDLRSNCGPDTTILYLTDNSLNEEITKLCRDNLEYRSNYTSGQGIDEKGYDYWWDEYPLPIIAVSQKPLESYNWESWNNICVGDIGRSWKSLYTQILAGLNATETKYVGIAEHDCLYCPEHWEFVPKEDRFYYNRNHWLYNWNTKEYQYISFRKAMSQMICKTKLLKEYVIGVLKLLEEGLEIKHGYRWYGEPGLFADKYREYFKRSGISEELKNKFLRHISKFKSSFFTTEDPNVDIRHNSNFTGKKKGRDTCLEIPYWSRVR